MAVPTLLKSTDASAPALSGEDGKLYDVLKWALPQLGWTVEFDGAGAFDIAFRNSPTEGTGHYIQIRDAAANHAGGAEVAEVKGYKSMTALNTGTDVFPTTASWMRKSNSPSATAVPWFVLGTSTCFYYGRATTKGDYNISFCGNFSRAALIDVSNFGVFCGVDSGTSAASDSCFIQKLGPVADDSADVGSPNCVSSVTGTTSPVTLKWGAPTGLYESNTAFQPGRLGAYPCPITGNIYGCRVALIEGSGLRGQFPGLIVPLHDMRLASQSDYAAFDTVPIYDAGTLKNALFMPTDAANDWTVENGAISFDTTTDWSNW